MFKKLHLQLTFFCTLVTGLILITMSVVCLYIAESGIRNNSYTSFLNNLNSMLTHLEDQSVISHQWLLQIENSYRFQVRIDDNGNPLFFEHLNPQEASAATLLEVQQIAKDQYALDVENYNGILSKNVDFKLTGMDGQNYYASVALLPKEGGVLSVTTLYSLAYENGQIMLQRFYFGVVVVLSLVLLSVFSWLFTKRMIKPIQKSREKQVQFIASASHELRSPLTVILSSLSAMKLADKTESERFSNSIQDEGQRMSRLIGDMLTLANADNQSWSVHPEQIEMDTLLLQTYEKYEPLAKTKGLTLNIQLPEHALPPCHCDGERIAQILSILLDNAFSYTPFAGTVWLKLLSSNGKIELIVSDNGPGIPDEDKKSVFDRFYRADTAHKDKAHFGLGLCIAQEIVKLHKGKIRIEDTPNGGATFVISLPQSLS